MRSKLDGAEVANRCLKWLSKLTRMIGCDRAPTSLDQRRAADGEANSVTADEDVWTSGLAFLRSAFNVLEGQFVLPRPAHSPRIAVGSDYFGPDLESVDKAAFEEALVGAFPDRLLNGSATDSPSGVDFRSFEFTTSYIFATLESAVGYSTQMANEEAYEVALSELLDFLAASPNAIASHRILTHISVDGPVLLDGGAVEIRDLSEQAWVDVSAITELPGLEGDSLLSVGSAPKVVLSAHGEYSPSTDWSDQFHSASDAIGRVVLGLRLYRRSPARDVRQWTGFTARGGFVPPMIASWSRNIVSALAFDDPADAAVLDQADQQKFDDFLLMFDHVASVAESVSEDRELGSSSWFTALSAFHDSFGDDPWSVQVPRLIRSMEGALLPEPGSEAIASRLRARLCLLLQTDAQSCADLFESVNVFYSLRSSVEHAADVKAVKQMRSLSKGSRLDGALPGTSSHQAVEELRDLARRSIVVRVILASGTDPLWPIDDTKSVDLRLLEDGFRQQCRDRIEEVSRALGPGLL